VRTEVVNAPLVPFHLAALAEVHEGGELELLPEGQLLVRPAVHVGTVAHHAAWVEDRAVRADA
jgi:hypothetical protein